MPDFKRFNPLDSSQVDYFTKEFGKNIVAGKRLVTPLERIIKLLISPLVFLLIVVALISLITGELKDAIFIGIVILINTAVGYYQENRAEKAIEALKNSLSHKSKVIRDNKLNIIDSSELVPGDIVLLETGDRIPADGMILESSNLSINESQLTGESIPVEKLDLQQVFMSTFVVSGKGVMRVENIGMKTRIGEISLEISKKSNDTAPIEKKIANITAINIIVIVVLFITLIGISLLNGIELTSVLSSLIALAISAIPESLPIILLVTLAVGAYRMERQKVILKNLPSTATLSSVDIICTDKTGTLTVGKLELIDAYSPVLDNSTSNSEILKLGALCSSVNEKDGKFIGDFLDVAIAEKLMLHNININDLKNNLMLIDEIPFDSEYKYHAVLYKDKKFNKKLIIVKGAVENILRLSRLDQKQTENIKKIQDKFTNKGYKVIAIASKHSESKNLDHEHLREVNFKGLLIFSDVLRADISGVIKNIMSSGIQVIMITGDQANAAKNIGKEVGIYMNEKIVINSDGKDIKDELLNMNLDDLAIISRATPNNKLELIDILRSKNKIVAMTGDGVNDAPALIKADIGISMGEGGTDVARESSDMILVDNNFTSIVSGIEEARVVFENIRKSISYLFSTTIGESLTIMVALLLGLNLPLTATQILFLKLATDGALDTALAVEPKEKNVINFHPQRYKEGILNRNTTIRLILHGVFMGLGGIWLHLVFLIGAEQSYINTSMLVYLTVIQWFIVLSTRTASISVFKAGLFTNKVIIITIVSSFLLLLFVAYTPFGQNLLGTTAIRIDVWLISLLFGFVFLFLDEIRKHYKYFI